MRKLLLCFIVAFFCCPAYCIAADDMLKIIYINTSEVIVDGKSLHVGDSFESDAVIRWDNPRQVLKVINMSTRKQKILKPEPIEVTTSNSTGDYMNLDYNLSTRDELQAAAYFFLEYADKSGSKFTYTLSEGTSLEILPSENVSLLYCDADSGQDAMITDDFMGFLEEFKSSDKIISYVVDHRKYWDIYKCLMWVLMDRPHCEVEFTMDDVDFFKSLK